MSFDLAAALKDVSNSDTGREQIEYIPLEKIDSDENNFYGMSDIEPLADNIALCGLQQPIRLREQADGRYRIVSGHRRRAALLVLVADGYEKYRQAPCIVERDEVSPALQQLRLIYANANTRKMTSAEISEQAEQVEKLLYQLKEEGYDFPGRMRDHVAEAVGHSKSKLARLKVIRENLAAVWVDAWKDGTIGESVAYNLSQMPKSWQTLIHADWGDKTNRFYADTVERLKRRFQNLAEVHCQHGLTLCEHVVYMMGKSCRDMQRGDYVHTCTGCCSDCSILQICENCCPQALSKQKELKAVAKQANLDAKREQEERDRPGAEFARMVWDRIGKARERIGASIESVVLARKGCYSAAYDDPEQKKMESGEGDYGPNSTISFGSGIRACDMMKVVAVADALQCSVDYLLGRTEDRQSHLNCTVEESPVPYQGTGWLSGKPSALGDYIILVRFPKTSRLIHQKMTWNGNGWEVHGEPFEFDDARVICWIPMPTILEQPNPANNESCITGMSPSGHCGAAAYCSNECTCCLQCPDDSCNSRCGWIDDVAEEI